MRQKMRYIMAWIGLITVFGSLFFGAIAAHAQGKTIDGPGLVDPPRGKIIGVAEAQSLGEWAGVVINFFLGFTGLVAAVFIIAGAFYVVTDSGTGDGISKGRKSIIGAIIGIILIFASYTIVSTFITMNVGERAEPQRIYIEERVILHVSVTNNITRALTGTDVQSYVLNRFEEGRSIGDLDGATATLRENGVYFTCKDAFGVPETATLFVPQQKLGVKCETNNVSVWFENYSG